MKTPEQIQALKQISIIGFLQNNGFEPFSSSSSETKYIAPWRDEKTASLSVNHKLNIFYDFGDTEKKGSIIDFVMMWKKVNFSKACEILEEYDGKKINSISNPNFIFCRPSTPRVYKTYEITQDKPIEDKKLIAYIESRGIKLETASRYFSEIHYKNEHGKFYGIGCQTSCGGYVVRSHWGKKAYILGEGSYKLFEVPNSKDVAVFEGMFDYLTAVELSKKNTPITVIVLNSTKHVDKALPIIKQYEKVFCYLDNDDAGYKALDKLKQAGANVFDCSHVYKPFNDFNSFITI
jgi:DNA primase